MRSLKLSLGNMRQLELHMTDFNRLRWCVSAIEANTALLEHLRQLAAPAMYDSTCMVAAGINPVQKACVVLWDGFSSYLELLRNMPHLQSRTDLKYWYIGAFFEIAQALPYGSQPLFPRRDSSMLRTTSAPLAFRAAVRAKAAARRFKNMLTDSSRHKQLAKGGQVVFCGVVRPTQPVLANMLTSAKLQSLSRHALQLGALHWNDAPDRITAQIHSLYEACRTLGASSAEDYSGLYSLLNICSRMAVIGRLHAAGCQVFISEFGFQKNFDAYDTGAYRSNTFLDFGSSRGACHWYPRTVDLRANGKHFLAMRLIQEEQSLGSYLSTHSETDFSAQLDAHAADVLRSLN